MRTETEICHYLKEKWRNHFPNFKLIGFEHPIIGCISGKRIGQADIAFKSSGINYLIEIKFDDTGTGDFWTSLKVIGYAKSMNLAMFKNKSSHCGFYSPVIMIKRDLLTYDVLPILYHLKCGYISFDIKEDFIDFDVNLNHSSENFI